MTEKRKSIFKRMDKAFGDYLSSYKLWRVFHTDTGGYTEDETEIHVNKNSLCIWQGDNSVYLDGEQLKHVLDIAKEHGVI